MNEIITNQQPTIPLNSIQSREDGGAYAWL